MFSFNSLFVTTDAPLLFFWALTALFFHQALNTDAWRDWLAAGLIGGLGLLSKYTMILLPLGIMIYVAGSHRSRLLRNPKLWCGFGLAALVYLPNLLWNFANQFISFRHTTDIAQLSGDLLHPVRFLAFVAGQFAVFGFVSMAVLVALAVRRSSYRDDSRLLLLSLSLPCLLLISFQALLSDANINWAAPAYVTGSIACARVMTSWKSGNWRIVAISLNILLMMLIYHYPTWLSVAGIQANQRNDPYHRILGWRELGQQVSPWRTRYPAARLLSDDRELLAYVGYYADPRFNEQVAAWNPDGVADNHYELVADIANKPHGEFIFVSAAPLSEAVRRRFARGFPLAELQEEVYPTMIRRIYLYYLEDFLGYQ